MKKHPKVFEEFYSSTIKKHCPEISKYSRIKEFEKNFEIEKIKAYQDLDSPISIIFFTLVIFLSIILSVCYSGFNLITIVFMIIFFPPILIIFGLIHFLFVHKLKNLIITVRFKPDFISYKIFYHLINGGFENYINIELCNKIKVNTDIFRSLIRESSSFEDEEIANILYLKDIYLKNKPKNITLSEFKKMVSYIFNI